MKKLDLLVVILILIGAINWGLVGLIDFDAISYVFGAFLIDRVIYILIGLAGVYQIVKLLKANN
ncbi:MAG: hypothetical protein HW387_591 [Parachlamydiales bacterium]|nr:hypothetical protein [Parachlamydiales bacterium]